MTLVRSDRQQALGIYRAVAQSYERRLALLAPYRRRAVELLSLSPGESVLDVACGTGVNFPLLVDKVGENGKIVGVDLSPEMLAVAADRVRREGWSNVDLVEAALEEADLPGPFDAALFSLTHDVLQSPTAVEQVLSGLRPGGRVALFGAKRAPRWRVPVNLVVRRMARRYLTTPENLDRPWGELERHGVGLTVRSVALGGAYLAWGAKDHR